METLSEWVAVLDGRFAWWLLGVVLGLAIGLTWGVLVMASMRLARSEDEHIETMLAHGGYESARPFTVHHDMTKGGRIV